MSCIITRFCVWEEGACSLFSQGLDKLGLLESFLCAIREYNKD